MILVYISVRMAKSHARILYTNTLPASPKNAKLFPYGIFGNNVICLPLTQSQVSFVVSMQIVWYDLLPHLGPTYKISLD